MPKRLELHLKLRAISVRIAIIASIALMACHAASNVRSPNNNVAHVLRASDTTRALRGVAIGDTQSFGARIVGIKSNIVASTAAPPSFRTSFSLVDPAYLIWIEVVPGQSIALLYPTNGTPIKRASSGDSVMNFSYTALTGAPDLIDRSTLAQKCVDDAVARATRNVPPPRRYRDKNGTWQTEEPKAAPTIDYGAIRRSCAMQGPKGTVNQRPGIQVQESERYLVMLASHVAIKADKLNQRLDNLEVSASSVKSTIEAIAQGLYVDKQAVWAGYYVAW